MPERTDISRVVAAARLAGAIHARRRFVAIGGWAAVWALGVALVAVLVTRLVIGLAWWWAIPAGALAIGLVVTLVLVVRSRWSLAYAAGEIDRVADTEGALRTALEINDSDGEPALVTMARQRGASVASTIDPKRASSTPDTNGWRWALPIAGCCAAAGLLVSPIRGDEKKPDTAPIVQRAIEGIETAAADVAQVDPAALPEPEAWAETFEEIEALEEELRRGEGGADAPVRAAAALEDAADELERQAEQSALEEQRLRASAQNFDTEPSEDASPDASALVDRLADALARNDMLDAERAARDIDQARETMSEAERRALAETLEDLADRLEPGPETTSGATPESQAFDPGDTSPNDAGQSAMDGTANREGNPSDPAESIEPTPGPDESSESAAADPGGVSKDRDTAGESDSPTDPPSPAESQPKQRDESLSEALREQAESLRDPGDPAAEQTPPNESNDTNEPGDQQGEQPGDQTSERSGDPAATESKPRPQDGAGSDQAQEPGGTQTQPNEQPGAQTEPDPAAGEQQYQEGQQRQPGQSGNEEQAQKDAQGTPSTDPGDQPPSQQPSTEPNANPSADPNAAADPERTEGTNETGTDPKQPSEQPGQPEGDRGEGSEQPSTGEQPPEGEPPTGEPQPGEQQPGDPDAGESPQEGPPDGSQPTGAQPTGSEPSGTEPTGSVPEGTPTQGEQPGANADGAQGEGQPESAQPGEGQPGESQQGEGQPGDAQPGQVERAVRRMRDRQSAREQNQRVAESLRERARDLVGDSPDDGANQNAGGNQSGDPSGLDDPGGGAGSMPWDRSRAERAPVDPSRFEPVDASSGAPSTDETGRVVGDWFDPDRQELPATERAAAASEMRRAARRARDAVDNQQVPRRYRDLIKRVFDRVERRAAEVAPAGPAAPGQDAKPIQGSSSGSGSDSGEGSGS